MEALLAIGQTINVVDPTDSEDRLLQNGPFRLISVSANGKFVALYTDDGKVWVVSADFQDKLSEYDSRVKTPPKDMQWCGNDAVVLAWDDEVHLIGPNGAASKYVVKTSGHMILRLTMAGITMMAGFIWYLMSMESGYSPTKSVNSCRESPVCCTAGVVSYADHGPDKVENAFRLGSTSPSAVLLDAADQYDKRSPKADDNLQFIKPHLVEAVDDCIEAAGLEFNIHWQKQLLKAASFGKTVLDLYDSDDFVEMSEVLRILNAARFYEVGLPLSYEQYRRLNPERLIQRLVSRQEYLLALRVSEYLRLPTDRIYVHWAAQKVRISTEDDDTTCLRIVEKLKGRPGISFEQIAKAAHDEGRLRLATALLNHEPRASKQVPLLLTMEEDTVALDKAIESGDTDLILYVLLQLKKKLPLASFFRTINSRPVASALVESTASEQDRQLLKDLYYQDDRRLDGANLLFLDALAQPDTTSKIDKLKIAARLVNDARDSTLQARSIDELQRLLRFQESLDNDPSFSRSSTAAQSPPPSDAAPNASDDRTITFTGLSLNATLYHLIRLGATKRALKLSSDFKVPDKTLWFTRLRGLIAARAFRDLETLANNNKRSPIGWEPFFNATLEAGQLRLAGVFVAKCTGVTSRERAEMWEKCGMIGKAAEEAGKSRDAEFLQGLRERVAGGREALEVERWIGVVSKGR